MPGGKTTEQRAAEKEAELRNQLGNLQRDKRAALRAIESDAADVAILLQKTPSKEVVNQIAAYLDSHKATLDRLAAIDIKLMKFLPSDLNAEQLEAKENEIASDYLVNKTQFNKLFGSYHTMKEQVTQPEPTPVPERNSSLFTSLLEKSIAAPLFNINDIQVPKFDGTFANFPEFYNEFTSTVSNNEIFDDTIRLRLLKKAMTGKMVNYLKDVGSDGKLYRPTLKNLYDTYYNRRRIIAEHFATIVDLPSMKTEEAREGIDTVKRAMRGLEVCNINVESMSPFIAFLVARKIPHKLRQDWDMSNADYSMYQSFDSLATLLNAKCLSAEADGSYSPKTPKPKDPKKGFNGAGIVGAAAACPICKEEHSIEVCKVFLAKSRIDRFNLVKTNRICIRCLKKGHSVSHCNSTLVCKTCKGVHHTMLHRELPNKTAKRVDGEDASNKNSNSTDATETPNGENKKVTGCAFSDKTVFLSTAIVAVKSKAGTEVGRIFLDPGSQTTLVTQEFCDRAKLETKRSKNSTFLVSVHGDAKELTRYASFLIKSRYSDFSIAIEAEITNKVPYCVDKGNLGIDLNQFSFSFAETYDLPYSYCDMLLGNEYYELCMTEKRHFIENLCLKESHFGVVLAGSAKRSFFAEKVAFCGLSNVELDNRLRNFFEYDVPSSNKVDVKAEFALIEKHFVETYSIDKSTGRFVIRLPVRDSICNLKSSYERAKALLLSSERRRSTEEQDVYCRIFNEYLELEHMRKLTNFDVNNVAYFIPHHLVKMNRIVYNASFSFDGIESLNSQLLPGPVLQPKLFSHIIRFRIDLIVVSADIFRMYRSIKVHPDDWKYQTILFRFLKENQVDVYALITLVNGVGPASYIATRCLEVIAEMLEQNKSPVDLADYVKALHDIVEVLIECIRFHFYMDNFMRGFTSVNQAKIVVEALRKVLDSFGFRLCKFQSNSSEFLSTLEPELIDELKTKVFSDNSELYSKVLGLHWVTESDELRISIPSSEVSTIVTKRSMLSGVSKLYDIIGVLSPVSIRAKLLLQELWKEGRAWDEPVSDELKQLFIEYCNDLAILHSFSLPRAYCYAPNIVNRQIIGFCDASTRAYCAVVYLRSIDKEGNSFVSFICAKTRVAPIKPVQIHRLELLAMELLANLLVEVNLDLQIGESYLFSDSMVSLSWLNMDSSRLLLFVSNRVRKILATTCADQWRHVDGIDNPADLATRGISSSTLFESSLWKYGPSWVNSNEFEDHISKKFKPDPFETLPERKVTKTTLFSGKQESLFSSIGKSSFNKTVGIVAYMLRFIRNIKIRRSENETRNLVSIDKIPPLSVEERTQAFNHLVLDEQKLAYANEYNEISTNCSFSKKNKLRSLNPFCDESGLLRVRGRLSNSAFSYDTKHPIILPANCRFIRVYAEHIHNSFFHANRSLMFTTIRSKFWVVGGLMSLIKSIIFNCVFCTRIRGSTSKQIMADLPSSRVAIGRPFTTTGVDFSGHIQVRCVNHRSTKYYKVYISFFVCFATRAVHLELVEDLSTEAFSQAFDRFISRRGLPHTMYSDNGTNFVGFRNLISKKHALNWKFIPARSPHQGGLWEAAVKAGKACILRAIGSQILSFAELNTLVVKVEGILNSRPIAYSKLGNDIEPLTPGHFLVGSSLKENPVVDSVDSTYGKFKVRYRLWRSIIDSFWTTWRKSYLNQLQIRNKWQVAQPNIKKGDVVLLKLQNTTVMEWPMGLIVDVFPDDVGNVRTVSVRLASGSIRRTAVTQVVLLPAQ